jgi:SAM-dependent methyltransferase
MFSLRFLRIIRAAELELILSRLPKEGRVLEIGAGTGEQALALSARGFDVVAVDVESSGYRHHRVFPVTEYDGRILPFTNESFDVVFSSNVLEHIVDLRLVNLEIGRVLRRGGFAIHLMPSPSWRGWTTLGTFAAVIQELFLVWTQGEPDWAPVTRAIGLRRRVRRSAYLLTVPFRQRRHGERGSIWSELSLFRSVWWRRVFEDCNFEVIEVAPSGLFYTGNMVLGEFLTIPFRRSLARYLGSACTLYLVKPRGLRGAV